MYKCGTLVHICKFLYVYGGHQLPPIIWVSSENKKLETKKMLNNYIKQNRKLKL